METTEETTSRTKSTKTFNKDNSSNRNPRRKGPIRLSKIKYEEKIVQVKRVTKVTTGGKKMTFRAIVIIGDNPMIYFWFVCLRT